MYELPQNETNRFGFNKRRKYRDHLGDYQRLKWLHRQGGNLMALTTLITRY